MTWEVSVIAAGSEAEGVSACLEALGSQGVVVAEWEEEGSPPVLEAGVPFARAVVKGYFPAEADREGLDVGLRLLLAAAGLGDGTREMTWQLLAERDWQEAWKESWHPLPVGHTLLILPSWREPPPELAQRLTLRLDPGMAFGSGTHQTTRGCLEALERRAAAGGLGRVLDVGTGSGILAIAAALLGARRVTATDNDPVAVRTCLENCRANGVGERVQVELAEEVPEGPFDLIVANILAGVLISLAGPLAAALAPGGRLLLSGILAQQAPAVEAAHAGRGLTLVGEQRLGDWMVLELTKGSER